MSKRGKCKRPLKKMTVNSENRGQNASLRSQRGLISGVLRRLCYYYQELRSDEMLHRPLAFFT